MGVIRLPLRALLMAAVLALAALAAGCGGSVAAPPGALTVGLVANSLESGGRMGAVQDAARRVGTQWLREEVMWARVERRPGERDWRSSDRVFASAARRGIRLLPLLNEAPRWAVPEGGGLPTEARAYGAFVRDAVQRYGRGGAFWREHRAFDPALAPRWFELWNEPYYAQDDDGETDLAANAARYAALAAAGLAAGHRAGRGTRLLLSLQTAAENRPGADVAWLSALADAHSGLLRAADGYAAHPYGIVEPAGFLPLDDLLAALDERGLRRPIWITEVGWSTCRSESECVPEEQQAEHLTTLIDALRGRYAGRVDAAFLYHLYDWNVDSSVEREGSYGLVRVDGTRKPAWWSYRRAMRSLPGG